MRTYFYQPCSKLCAIAGKRADRPYLGVVEPVDPEVQPENNPVRVGLIFGNNAGLEAEEERNIRTCSHRFE